jgi:hypothetical protein
MEEKNLPRIARIKTNNTNEEGRRFHAENAEAQRKADEARAAEGGEAFTVLSCEVEYFAVISINYLIIINIFRL